MGQSDETWLFVPAKGKFLDKFEEIESEIIILDLEDSLAPEQKEEGLELVQKVIERFGKERTIYVRVNSGERLIFELQNLRDYEFDGYMIPKFENPDFLEEYEELLTGKKVIALVESIKGIFSLEKIASHPLVNILAFGGEDFCKEISMEAGEEVTIYARNQLVMYAAFNGKTALDSISLEIRDMEIFAGQYQKSKRMGFNGKLLIHPNQARAVRKYREKFDKQRLQRIIDIYNDSKEAIVQIDGQVYEPPHIEKIKKYLQNF